MKEFFKNIVNSFYNNREGFAARKLTAFALVACIVWVHLKHVTDSNAAEVIMIDIAGVFLCLGIITVQNLIELKNGTPKQ
ncbi:MAG: hypothetical protein KF900_13955 [Bacteroidetes bacterium]|nr:hypothetical protein [Bacteroidota bacterium]